MKYLLFLLTAFAFFNCKAQVSTVGIYEAEHDGKDNYYYKDLNKWRGPPGDGAFR